VPGFGPAAEPLWFRSKWPNPCWPWCGPSGFLCGSPTPAARKLAELGLSLLEGLKQCAPFLRCRLHCSATPQGQGRLLRQARQKVRFGLRLSRVQGRKLDRLIIPASGNWNLSVFNGESGSGRRPGGGTLHQCQAMGKLNTPEHGPLI